MASLNKIMAIGNLGRDPEVRQMPNGDKVASVSIAVTEKFKDRNGQAKESTEWMNLVLFRRQAEICQQYLRKGSSIYVEGKLKTSSWEKDGQKHFKTEIVVSNFQMLGSKGGSSETQASQPSQDIPPYQDDSSLPF